MRMLEDKELLAAHANEGSETAFATLVERHISLVYSSALRQTHNPHLAEEITQAVFILLARKAGKLSRDTVLPGWLCRTAQFAARNALKAELRRQQHETKAQMESLLHEPEPDAWPEIAPLLDAAVAQLSEADRNAIVLRYYQQKPLDEVGRALGLNADAAQKRVARALEKLRKFFTRRGVALSAAAIAGAVSANSVQAAPTGLAAKVSVIAAKGAATTTSITTLVKGTLKIMAWTKAKTAILTGVAVLMAVGIATGVHAFQSSPAAKLRAALHLKRPPTGTWSYPTIEVQQAINDFGSNRANAFPILEQAVRESDSEIRKQAIAGMGFIVRPAITNPVALLLAHHVVVEKLPRRWIEALQAEPATNAIPILRTNLFANNDLSSLALASLHGLLEAKDIPALADLLVQSHGGTSKQEGLAHLSNAFQAQSVVDRAKDNQQMQRYLPEAIAETIQQNPETVAPFISSVEDLLNDENTDVRFGAACALAKCKAANDSRIFKELTAGLQSRHDDTRPYTDTESLKQLMAIETLQKIGANAKPMIPVLLDYAKSIDQSLMRELAFRAVGHIDNSLRNTIPEVDQALKNDPTLKSQ